MNTRSHTPLHLQLLAKLMYHVHRYAPDLLLPSSRKVDLYASQMHEEQHGLFDRALTHFCDRAHCEAPHRTDLENAAHSGTILYVTTHCGHWEYHCYQHFLQQMELPLADFTSNFSHKRWMTPGRLIDTLLARAREVELHGSLPDPFASGYVTKLLSRGHSVMFNLPSSSIWDDALAGAALAQLRAAWSAQAQARRPVYIVPLAFIWDRRVRKSHEPGLMELLFGEKEDGGRLRRTILFFRHYGRRAVVQIGKPIELPQLDASADLDTASRDIIAKLRAGWHAERRLLAGPPLRPRAWYQEQVLTDDTLDRELVALAVQSNQSVEHVRMLAQQHIREIAANMDEYTVELCARALRLVLRSLYERVDVSPEDLQRVRALAARHPVVFVPNHKSHADYLILSCILHEHRIPVPYIAAGKNLSFWPLGPLFRRCGAYFIRRSFRGNQVYTAVLSAYLRLLVQLGSAQEFFIEGGRSRSGKLGAPKLGLLSMLLKAARDTEQNVQFIPVSFTYDRVPEHQSYVQELSGKEKRTERRRDLMKLLRFLRPQRQEYGAVYLRFGNALSTADLTGDITQQASEAAACLCGEINRGLVITPAQLVAAAMLADADRGVPRDKVIARAQQLLHVVKTLHPAAVAEWSPQADARWDFALQDLTQHRLLTLHQQPLPFYTVDPQRRQALDYIKNGAMHVLWLPAAWCCAPYAEEGDQAKHFARMCELFVGEFSWRTTSDEALLRKAAGDESTRALLVAQLLPFLEGYRLLFTQLSQTNESGLPEAQLLQQAQQLGRSLRLLGELEYAESTSRAVLAGALAAAQRLGLATYEASHDAKHHKPLRIIHLEDRKRLESLQTLLEQMHRTSKKTLSCLQTRMKLWTSQTTEVKALHSENIVKFIKNK